mmetsp:Transcript_13777/g.30387  ORF Transcript_13777/g.30387 Transcript_13777/m.30387 type:complete len:334 (+) Transcript_13777:159-1160(+)
MVPTALVVVLWLIIDHASGFLLAPTLHTALRSSIPSTSAFPTARRGSSIPLNLKKGCGIDPDMTFGPNGEDLVWEALRSDAKEEASKEPLLASFMHASILSHKSLERCLAYHMANLLNSPAMISTQIQALFLEAFEGSDEFRQSLRLDILAVMIRDPAIKSYTDVILYFKGFQALQTHRVSHWLWHKGRITLALFLQSRSNTVFHIDIHPGATLGNGLLIDHGTGVVIGETARVGDNVSMLHKVTLGGSGNKDVIRHPQVGDCVLLGAGATLLGPITVGNGAHIGACSMVLEDVPSYSVAVGVPAKIISRNLPVGAQYSPALTMETNMFFFDI